VLAPRGILLDFYGTVVHEDGDVVAAVCREVHAGIPHPGSVAVRDIGRYWWQTFQTLCAAAAGPTFRTQRAIERDALHRTIAHVGSHADADRLSKLLYAYWQRPPVFEDAWSFLHHVDVPVCIVSNIDRADLEAAVDHHGLPVDLVVTSDDVRSYKPRPECFLAGLQRLGRAAHEVVHVGDSRSSDVAGATALGIPTVWVNRTGKVPDDGRHAHEVRDLAELARLLGQPLPSTPHARGRPARGGEVS
jgi:2-haloacid dehalogenase/putative hydrolase of the HAD superfamily